MFLIALISLSDVCTRPGDSISLSATNCNAGGIMSFVACALIFMPLSSLKSEISINDCSNEVSFKSAAVDNSFLKSMLPTVGWSVAHSSFPSPPTKDELKALFKTLDFKNYFKQVF